MSFINPFRKGAEAVLDSLVSATKPGKKFTVQKLAKAPSKSELKAMLLKYAGEMGAGDLSELYYNDDGATKGWSGFDHGNDGGYWIELDPDTKEVQFSYRVGTFERATKYSLVATFDSVAPVMDGAFTPAGFVNPMREVALDSITLDKYESQQVKIRQKKLERHLSIINFKRVTDWEASVMIGYGKYTGAKFSNGELSGYASVYADVPKYQFRFGENTFSSARAPRPIEEHIYWKMQQWEREEAQGIKDITDQEYDAIESFLKKKYKYMQVVDGLFSITNKALIDDDDGMAEMNKKVAADLKKIEPDLKKMGYVIRALKSSTEYGLLHAEIKRL